MKPTPKATRTTANGKRRRDRHGLQRAETAGHQQRRGDRAHADAPLHALQDRRLRMPATLHRRDHERAAVGAGDEEDGDEQRGGRRR